jgi:hypothetical protein
MVSYAAGTSSAKEKVAFENHCLSCDECLTTLAVILRLSRSPIRREEKKALAPLYPIGVEAARKAAEKAMVPSNSLTLSETRRQR